MFDAKAPRKTMRKVRWRSAARAVPRAGRDGTVAVDDRVLDLLDGDGGSPSPHRRSRSGRLSGVAGTCPWYGRGSVRLPGSGTRRREDAPARLVEGGGRRHRHGQHGRGAGAALHLVDPAEQVWKCVSAEEEVRRVRRGEGHPQPPAGRKLGHGGINRVDLRPDELSQELVLPGFTMTDVTFCTICVKDLSANPKMKAAT